MAITTKRQAQERQESDVADLQEKHGALDVAAAVAAVSTPNEVVDGVEYEESQLRRAIPWGFQLEEVISRAYAGDTYLRPV